MEAMIEVGGLSELEPELTTADVNRRLLEIRENRKKIAQRKEKCDEEIAFAKELMTNAKDNFNADTYRERETIDYLTGQLEIYYEGHRPTRGKFIKFSAGSIGYSDNQTKYFYGDAEAKDSPEFLRYVEKHYPQFVKLTPSVDWSALKKQIVHDGEQVTFKETGEVIAGLRAKKTFAIKTIE